MTSYFDLPDDIASVLQNYELSSEAREELFTIVLKEIIGEIDLRPYLTESRATVIDGSLKISDGGLRLNDDWTGRLYVEFEEDLWMGCRDIGGVSGKDACWEFAVDFDRRKIVITSLDEQEREPDDL